MTFDPSSSTTAYSRSNGRPEPSAAISAANVVLRHRRLVLLTVVIVTVVMTGLAFMRERTWSSTTAFMPQSSGGSLAGLSSLAAQFGVNVAKEDPTQSPDFYSEVIKSRNLLAEIAADTFTVPTPEGQKRGTVAEILEIEAGTPVLRSEEALRELREAILVRITRQTGVVHVTVKTPYPALSRQLAERLLVELDEFNSKLRQDRAAAEERFLEQREAEARENQVVAEQRLVQFLQSNRNYNNVPALSYQEARLSREASYRAEVVSTLAQGRAQARIEAARNTPVITILDAPNDPARPDPRGAARTAVLSVLLGTVLGIVFALVRDAFRKPDGEDELAQFERLRAEAAYDMRHPVGALLMPRRQRYRKAGVT